MRGRRALFVDLCAWMARLLLVRCVLTAVVCALVIKLVEDQWPARCNVHNPAFLSGSGHKNSFQLDAGSFCRRQLRKWNHFGDSLVYFMSFDVYVRGCPELDWVVAV